MSGQKRVTQQDVAKVANVNRATVSLAIHNHPSIPPGTRERIRRIAGELGYTPDPMLSALAAYRNTQRTASYKGTLAWLVNSIPSFQWKKFAFIEEYYNGALRRASFHGYNLEVFDLCPGEVSPDRLAKILRFRNINGILLSPQPGPNWEVDFPWEYFSCVTFGYSLVRPRLHTVASTQFRGMMETMQQLYELGYARIGFACSFKVDERADHNFLGGYFVEKYLRERAFDIPPFDEESADPGKFLKWFRKYRPDAVVTGNPRLLEIIKGAGLKVPGDVGVASPTVPYKDSTLAGVYEDSCHMGEVAVDAVVGMVNRGERGVPAQPHYIHIPGIWLPGRSLKRRVEAEPPDAPQARPEKAARRRPVGKS